MTTTSDVRVLEGRSVVCRTDDTAHIEALTGVRGFAALWVFIFHAWIVAGKPTLSFSILRAQLDLTPVFAFGWLGVDLFFVLSGFLLTRQAWAKVARGTSSGWMGCNFGESYLAFIKRRILRVYPAYYAVISILLVLASLHIYSSPPEKLDLLLHLVMFHNLIELYITTINGVFWSIPFEWQFYLVFPILFIVMRRTPLIVFYAVAALLALGTKQWVIAHNDGYMQLHLPIRLDAFVAGMCAATLTAQHRLPRWSGIIAFTFGLIGLFGTAWIYSAYPAGIHYFDTFGLTRPLWIQASICLFLVGLSSQPHLGIRILGARVVVWLGLISYSAYLVHLPVLGLLKTFILNHLSADSATPSLTWLLATSLPIVIATSAALYYAIERPFQTSGRHRPDQTAPPISFWPRYPFAILGIGALVQLAFLVAVS